MDTLGTRYPMVEVLVHFPKPERDVWLGKREKIYGPACYTTWQCEGQVWKDGRYRRGEDLGPHTRGNVQDRPISPSRRFAVWGLIGSAASWRSDSIGLARLARTIIIIYRRRSVCYSLNLILFYTIEQSRRLTLLDITILKRTYPTSVIRYINGRSSSTAEAARRGQRRGG